MEISKNINELEVENKKLIQDFVWMRRLAYFCGFLIVDIYAEPSAIHLIFNKNYSLDNKSLMLEGFACIVVVIASTIAFSQMKSSKGKFFDKSRIVTSGATYILSKPFEQDFRLLAPNLL